MPTDSLFRPLAQAGASTAKTVSVTLNGAPLQLPSGTSVAAALLSAGVQRFRNSPVSGEGRAPYCMMGVCFECLLEIDGVPNRQGCLVALEAGMAIRTQDGMRDLLAESKDPAVALAQAMEAPHGL
ncbi:NAD(FAD)-dependent dehydrogenase [Rhodoferax koreense]|uniref:NAD(FAD)-dependent dehydrogenase n=1 Tax=Rhodoferax koreensis TaxID=1842727 RepID=A0A1P8K2D1_9BURK|nr:(2Fe-2S)-binding protein [Rhodoferax koreense]APW40168.1 NAD(FAD)-dependent dehydrogenase [Rhodoferax koreense]